MHQHVSEAGVVAPPGGERASSLLEVLWSHMCDRGVWPTWAVVDQRLHHAGTRYEDARNELNPGLVTGIGSRGWMLPSPDQVVSLTIGGIANCASGGDHVRTFMLLVQFAVEREGAWDYTSGDDRPWFSFEEAHRAVALQPGAHGRTVLRQVLSVIDVEPWCGGCGGDGDDRRFFVTRWVREFAGARTFSAYWEVRDRLTRPDDADESVAVAAQEPVQDSIDVADDRLSFEIHPLLRDALWLFRNGRAAEAAETALREVEARVDAMSAGAAGLPPGESFGQRRFSAAFNPDLGPILNVSHAESGYDQGEQDGMKFLFMGVYAGLRNPIGHRKFRPTDQGEATEILALANMCMRRLDTAESRRPADS